MAKKDFYDVLGVPKGTDEAGLKRAYRSLVRELHPDANPDDPKADEKFMEVKEAYDVLTDPKKKAMYDRYGMAAFENQTSAASSNSRAGGGFDTRSGGFGGFGIPFDDIFEGFAGGMRTSSAQRHTMPARGADHLVNVTISFEDSFKGVKHEVELTKNDICATCTGTGAAPGTKPELCPVCNGSGVVRTVRQTFLGSMATQMSCDACGGRGQVIKTPCRDCNGRGRVRKNHKVTIPIPAGVEDGVRLRMPGEGDPGDRGGPAGDLYIQLRVQPHSQFRRSGNDLLVELPISFTQAVLGDEVPLKTLDGTINVKVPEGTESGSVLRQRDRGFPGSGGYGRGDLRITVRVATPKRLNESQKEALLAFAKAMGDEALEGTNSSGKGIFDRVREAIRGDQK